MREDGRNAPLEKGRAPKVGTSPSMTVFIDEPESELPFESR
jgi:hypothetical protein